MTTSKTMKNRLYIQLFLLLGICALVSCRTEIDDYFDSSASQRIENEILKYRELLSSPQYGWAMEYFPGGTNQGFWWLCPGCLFLTGRVCHFSFQACRMMWASR